MAGAFASRNEVLGSILQVVVEEKWARVILDHLLKQEYLGVDCEGVSLGPTGKVTLVQVATPVGDVFIFDMMKKAVHCAVRTLLQSNVLKIMHGCQGDVTNLFAELGIICQHVFDTQMAQMQVDSKHGFDSKSKPGLNELNQKYGLPLNKLKGTIDYYRSQRYWEQRPLTDDMLCYAASDVLSLIKIYPELKWRIDEPQQFLETCSAKIRDMILNTITQVGKAGSPQTSTSAPAPAPKNVTSTPPRQPKPQTYAAFLNHDAALAVTTIVRNLADAQRVTNYLLTQEYVIVDVKTMNPLDEQYGKPRLVQVGTKSGQMYLFDVTSTIVIDFIKTFMKDVNLIKVMHDCRNAVLTLFFHHGMQFGRIFDLQLAHRSISSAQPGDSDMNIGLYDLSRMYGLPITGDYEQAQKDTNWSRRPMTQLTKYLATYDVQAMSMLYPLLKANVMDFEHVMSRSFNRVGQLGQDVNKYKNANKCETPQEQSESEDYYFGHYNGEYGSDYRYDSSDSSY